MSDLLYSESSESSESSDSKCIASVVIRYDDGSERTVEGLVIVAMGNIEAQKWDVELSEQVDLDRVLDFAYDIVDNLEGVSLDEPLPKKQSHLKLVKG